MLRQFISRGSFAVLLLTLVSCAPRSAVPRAEPYKGLDPELQKADGTVVKLSDFRSKVLLLNFWSTWCKSCMSELRAFENLARSHSANDLMIIGIVVDDAKENLAKLPTERPDNLLFLFDSNAVLKNHLEVRSLPTTFVLDCRGEPLRILDPLKGGFVSRMVDAREWDSAPFRTAMRQLIIAEGARKNKCR